MEEKQTNKKYIVPNQHEEVPEHKVEKTDPTTSEYTDKTGDTHRVTKWEETTTTIERKDVSVPSKSVEEGKKIKITVRTSDLPKGVKKEHLEVMYGVEKISVETKDMVVDQIVKNGEQQEQKEKEEGKKKHFNPKFLALLLVPLLLLGIIKSCSNAKDIDLQETDPIKIVEKLDIDLYNMDNPSKTMHGVVEALGQEKLTNHWVDEKNAYNWREQAEGEEQSTIGSEHFEDLKTLAEQQIDIITATDSTQEQIVEAAEKLKTVYQEMSQIYDAGGELVEEWVKEFQESLDVYPDSNTEKEKYVSNLAKEEYFANLGLSQDNLEAIQLILGLNELGYDIDVTAVRENARGDYNISIDAIKEVIGEEDVKLSKAEYEKLLAQIRGDNILEQSHEEIGE